MGSLHPTRCSNGTPHRCVSIGSHQVRVIDVTRISTCARQRCEEPERHEPHLGSFICITSCHGFGKRWAFSLQTSHDRGSNAAGTRGRHDAGCSGCNAAAIMQC